MIKKIDIAGIQLENYTVRESIMQVEKSLAENGLCTIEEVTMDMLMLAETDGRVKEALEILNHTVIAENGILAAVGKSSMQRQHEIEDHIFFYELMKRLARNHMTVFLLGRTEEETQSFMEFLRLEFHRLEFAGAEAVENCAGETDAIVNEINAATPDAIVSILPSPFQETFLTENKDKLSANLWYGIGDYTAFTAKRRTLFDFFRKRSKIRALEKQVNQYQEQEESEK